MKYSIVTFGCRVNQADSVEIEAQLLARGGVAVEPRDADVVVVNTCSVTGALPPQVASRQSPDVDYVTGATQSANAFYYAVVEALLKAK